MKKKTILFALYGKSGAGKDAIVAEFLKSSGRAERAIRYTSRPKRAEEIEGFSYFFLSQEEAEQRITAEQEGILELHSHRGWHYFTSISSLVEGEINFGSFSEVAVASMIEVAKEKYSNLVIAPVKISAPTDVRLSRALERSPDTEETIRRFYTEQTDTASHDIIEPFETILNVKPLGMVDFKSLYNRLLEETLLRGV